VHDVAPFRYLYAPAPLHTDTCPMIDVVRDVLDRVPGPQDQIIVLLQPTQPLRQPYHIAAAILALEQNGGADSIVSVVELPATHAAGWQAWIAPDGALIQDWTQHPSCRQDLPKAYIRDGTVYAFRRGTVRRCGNIYGFTVRPLIIPQDETCPLDTLADWADAERRLRDRMGHG
jgi:N-acylneuraminate cytidylyltransferase